MIRGNLYNTAITDSSGQELTHYIYQQPVTDPDFTDAYWLGWIAWDNLPSGFILNSPIMNNGIFDPQPLTIPENLDIGYMGQYSTTVVTANYFRASKLFTWDGSQFRVASNFPGPVAEMANNREQRFVNKFNINLQAQNYFTLFFAIGVSTTEDGNSTCNAVYATNFGIEDFLTESYQITITNSNITVAGGTNNNPFSITITVNPTDIDGTVKQVYDSINNVYIKYAVIGYYTEGIYREIKEDGTASDYSYLTPMIRTHITVNDAVYPYILGGNSFMGLCAYYGLQRGYGYKYTFGSAAGLQVENNYNIWDNRDGAVIVFGGFQGTVADADASANCANNYNLWQPDGCNYCFQGINSITQCLIRRVFKYDDIKHHLSLMARWSDGTNTYDNGSDKWYSLVSEDNEFTGEFANGVTDRAKLRIWQLVRYDIDPENANYDTEDKPEYDPSPDPPDPPTPPTPPEPSVDAINLWSYKRDNVSPLVAGIFPYNGDDGGDGEFVAMIRSTLSKMQAERQEDGSLNIDFNLQLEDVIRKSTGEDDYIVGTLKQNNSSFNSFSTTPIITLYQSGTLSPAANKILDDKELQSGFYRGEVTSYMSQSNPGFTIRVKKEWIGAPEDAEEYSATVICEGGGQKLTQTVNSSSSTTITFPSDGSSLKAYDDEGDLINYIIYEDTSSDEDFPWTSIVSNDTINYDSENKIARITNEWNKISEITKETVIDVIFTSNGVAASDEKLDAFPIIYRKNFPSRSNPIPKLDDDDALTNEEGFESFMEYLESSDAINDWEGLIRENNIFESIKEKTMTAALFCSNYHWRQYSTTDYSAWHEITPFISIVTIDQFGTANFHHFKIEMNDPNEILNDIPYPYVSSRKINAGSKSTNMQWKIGAIGPDEDHLIAWDQGDPIDKDINIYWSGAPNIGNDISPFTTTLGNLRYSHISVKINNGQILLRNFCIYLGDRMCLDASSENAENLVPYYYEITIKEPASTGIPGVLKVTPKQLSKVNFTTIQLPPSNYAIHKWDGTWYYAKGSLADGIDIDKLNTALETRNKPFYDFIYGDDGTGVYKEAVKYEGEDN